MKRERALLTRGEAEDALEASSYTETREGDSNP